MRIAIFTGYFLPHLGGVERYVDKISIALQAKGHEVIIVTSNHNESVAYEELDGRKIYRLPTYGIAKQRYPIPKKGLAFNNLIKRIAEENVDGVILNTRFHLTSVVGARLAKKIKKPALLIEHGTGHFTVGNKFLDFFGGIYEHLLTLYLKIYVSNYYGVSKSCNVWLRHFHIDAKGVFYNSISKKDEDNIEDLYKDKYKDSVVITFAGRLIKEKGILNLVEAYKKLKQDHPQLNVRLVVAGDGDLFGTLKKKNKEYGIDFLGRLNFNKVMALYKRSDIFVHPSLYPEGLPTAILEAGLMNNAIIATPRGGTEEVIIDADHGIIVDGSINSLYSSLHELVSDSKKRLIMAKNAKSRIENVFDWDAVAKKVIDSLKRLDK